VLGSNQRRLSRRFYRPLSFSTSQSAADQHICAVQMRFSISYASMTSKFEELARPRTGSREATDGADGSGYADRPPPMPSGWAHPPPRKRPGCAADDTPQLITSGMCERQRLSRCSRQGSRSARSAVMYWNSLFGTVRSRRAERHFLSRWLSSGECAAKFSRPQL
jgi:hypothetical protein